MKIRFLILCVFVLSFFSFSSQAASNQFSILYLDQFYLKTDYISTPGTDVLPFKGFHFSTNLQYFNRPFEFTVAGNRIQSIIDHLAIQDLNASYAIKDFWQIDFKLPVIWFNHFQQAVVPGTGFDNKMGLGDIFLRSRFRILDKDEKFLGLTLIPFVTVPIGNENHYISDNSATGGLLVALEKQFGEHFSLGLMAGAKLRQNIIFQDYITKTMLNLGFGAKYSPSQYVDIKFDAFSQSAVNRPFRDRVTTPTEVLAGLDYHIPNSNIRLAFGGGAALVRGSGAPRFRSFLGLSYDGAIKKKAETIVRSIFFDTDKSFIRSTEEDKIKEVADKIHQKDSKSTTLVLEGHADYRASDEYNQKLSERRSESVRRQLVDVYKVDPSNFQVTSYGESRPLSTESTSEGLQLNRRVDIKLEINK